MNGQTLNHTAWECKCPAVLIPAYRRNAIFGQLRCELGGIPRSPTRRKQSESDLGQLARRLDQPADGYGFRARRANPG